ncbi:TetR/AcrR family transcriptional regulator [Streptomyces sp. NPDC005573]|uniref:TetR/AcrR family transcriptional regulator n=1 Tax=Streptomyces sp. NPDC005573 TaxID=3156890 RepID=UPI0033A81D4E
MIYTYYGSKDGLFDAVLDHHITAAQDAVTLDATDLPGYVLQVFDFYRAHPHLVRLAMWQSLERPELMAARPEVAMAMAGKAAAIREAQRMGRVASALPAERLLEQILPLAHGSITAAAHAEAWTDQQRHDLGVAVGALVRPSTEPTEREGGGDT